MKNVLLILLACLAGLSQLKAGFLTDFLPLQANVPVFCILSGDRAAQVAGSIGLGLVYLRWCLNSHLSKSNRDAKQRKNKAPKISAEELKERKKSHSFYYTLLKGLQVAIPLGLAAYWYSQPQSTPEDSNERVAWFEKCQWLGCIELALQSLF